MPYSSSGITREALREELRDYATKEDLNSLEKRIDTKFSQVVDELDTIQGKLDKLLNGSKPS